MTQPAVPALYSSKTQQFEELTTAQSTNITGSLLRYTEEQQLHTYGRDTSSSTITSTDPKHSRATVKRASPPLMNGLLGNAPQMVMYVRALYDYEADDRTSLSFHEGDIIQVITQLESGWWDGVINGVRGWFPSNYCQVIPSPEDAQEGKPNGVGMGIEGDLEDEEEEEEDSEEQFDDDADESERDDMSHVLAAGRNTSGRAGADFWIPQATPDGRLYYFNTETGENSTELPLESPSSATEMGPRDRMNVNIPEKTRPPAELMARGYINETDDESEGNSASEMEGESIMLASKSSFVCDLPFPCLSNC